MKYLFSLFIALVISLTSFGQLQQLELNLNDFHSIDLSGSFEVTLRMGSQCGVVLYGPEEKLAELHYEVTDHVLSILHDPNRLTWFEEGEKVKIYLTVTELHNLTLNRSIDFKSANILKGNRLQIEISGAAKIFLDLNFEDVAIESSGASSIELKGSSENSRFELSGATKIQAGHFQTQNMKLESSGSLSADVFVSHVLQIESSGVSDVTYTGNPTIESDRSFGLNIRQKK